MKEKSYNVWRVWITELRAKNTETQTKTYTNTLILQPVHLQIPQAFGKNSKDRFSEDVFHLKQRENPDIDLHYVLQIYNETLIVLENKCLSICGRMLLQFGLPVPTRKAHKTLDRGLIRETNYDKNILHHMVETNKPRLTGDQRTAYEAVMNFIAEGNGGILFLDALGGT
ncbi:hypothetical protein AVEN_245311-1 [Araneus ventricosus]|uniref:ATP-dependent DNA helicase n=1 Tax=Araneus ventricosus TaxID=182803 RepID=A0A4Y2VDB6_ARAVE|nr:hypothetical protein AVEN_229286-1 [Araneus ventricosus]GBO22508.1 hypothetical protein AVEN_245311-1 [Araneus ventricosus]